MGGDFPPLYIHAADLWSGRVLSFETSWIYTVVGVNQGVAR